MTTRTRYVSPVPRTVPSNRAILRAGLGSFVLAIVLTVAAVATVAAMIVAAH